MNIHAAHLIAQQRQADIHREAATLKPRVERRARRKAQPGLVARLAARLRQPEPRRMPEPSPAAGD